MTQRSNSGRPSGAGNSGGANSYAAYQQRSADEQKKARARSSNNVVPKWKMRQNFGFRPVWCPEDAADRDLSRYTDADYKPFSFRIHPFSDESIPFEYWSRLVKSSRGFRDVISNSRNGELNAPDLLWIKYCDPDLDDETVKNFRAGENYGLEIDILENHHAIQKKGKKKGSTFEVWVRCGGVDARGNSTCTHCGSEGDDGSVNEALFGRKQFWSMWSSHWKKLEDDLLAYNFKCMGCGGGDIQVTGWYCPEEGCEHVFGEVDEDGKADFNDDDSLKWRDNEVDCPSCEATVYAESDYGCHVRKGFGAKERWVEGCKEPIFANPFECVITVATKKSGGRNNVQLLDVTYLDDDDMPELTGVQEDQTLPVEELWGHMSLYEQAENLDMNVQDLPFDIRDGETALKAYLSAGPTENDSDSNARDDDDVDVDPIPF